MGKIKNKSGLFFFLSVLLLVITGLSYRLIFKGFFQHDEWSAFGILFITKSSLLTFFKPAYSHYTPFTNLLFYTYLSAFKLNFFWYALSSLAAHLVVVCLSFIIFLKFFKNAFWAFLSSLLFAIGASGHQATSWVGADITTHWSVIFALIALILLFKFNKPWLSIIFLLISLLFKEISIAFFIILPTAIFFFEKDKFKKYWKSYLLFPASGLLYLIFRFSMIFFQKGNIADRLVTETQSISNIIGNFVTFPAKIFSQSIIPTGLLLNSARLISKLLPDNITGKYGTTAFDVFTEGVTLQIINWIVFLSCLLILVHIIKKKNDFKLLKNTALFGFIFLVLNSFIYVLSPGRSGSVPVVDSRNIYFPSIGALLFLVSTIMLFTKQKIIAALIIILPIITINIYWLNKELTILAKRGTERKEILYLIKKRYPDLPDKTVFYMPSNTSFYGLPEKDKIFPFEVNLGYTLIVWYQSRENFPNGFLDQSFLYLLTEEGYREIDGRGFGYYRNWDSLVEAFKKNNLDQRSLIAFSYNSNNGSVEDITGEVRRKVELFTPLTK